MFEKEAKENLYKGHPWFDSLFKVTYNPATAKASNLQQQMKKLRNICKYGYVTEKHIDVDQNPMSKSLDYDSKVRQNLVK